MKHLKVTSEEYLESLDAFRNWLLLLGYAPTTAYVLPNSVNELLHWLERNGVSKLTDIDAGSLDAFWKYLVGRPNQRRQGNLSGPHLKKYKQAIRNFTRFLHVTKSIQLGYNFELESDARFKNIIFLTLGEIHDLYSVVKGNTILGCRDRAILAIFYSCALRRSEGEKLNVKDVNLNTRQLHVREGKGFKERLVPIAGRALADIETYLDESRPILLKDGNSKAFFISTRGDRLSGQMMYLRVKQLTRLAQVKKNVGLHTLRHSIATHLLQNGMQLHKISKFLGHESLESTQVYTHLVDD